MYQIFKDIEGIPCKGASCWELDAPVYDEDYFIKVAKHCLDNRYDVLSVFEMEDCEKYLNKPLTRKDTHARMMQIANSFGGEVR